MATIKVKFRQFAESEQGGSVYYRIYHRNQIRQIASGYTMQGDEWQSRNGSKSEKFPPSKPETEIIFRKIEFDKERFIRIITTFETPPEVIPPMTLWMNLSAIHGNSRLQSLWSRLYLN